MQLLDLSEPEIYKSLERYNGKRTISYTNIGLNILKPDLNRYLSTDLDNFIIPNINSIYICKENIESLIIVTDIYDNFFVITYTKLLESVRVELEKYYNRVVKGKSSLENIEQVVRTICLLSYLEPTNVNCVSIIEFNEIYKQLYNKRYNLALKDKLLAKTQDLEVTLLSHDISINFNYIRRNKKVKHYITPSSYIKLLDTDLIEDYKDEINFRLCPYCMTKEDSIIHTTICKVLREVN